MASRIVQQLYSLCKCLNSIWKVETTLETSIQKQLSHFKISIYSPKFCSTAQKIKYCMNVQKAWKLHLKFSFLSLSVKFICLWLITEQPAINVLKEVQLYLQKNPNEMVTIMIEDHVVSPTGVSKVFDAAGLRKFWFPVSQMPKKGGDWPTVNSMVQKNQRLLVFTFHFKLY